MGDNKLLALNNVDVTIKEGEFVSIMGSSGSGKSTLMNIIGCLDVPSNGDYFFRENNISNYSSNKLAELRNKDIGFIFQNFIYKKVHRHIGSSPWAINSKKSQSSYWHVKHMAI